MFATNMNAVGDLFSAEFLAGVEDRLKDYDRLRLAGMDAGRSEMNAQDQRRLGPECDQKEPPGTRPLDHVVTRRNSERLLVAWKP